MMMKVDNWDRLVEAAQKYCDLIEQRDRYNLNGFLRHCIILLSRLIHESATLELVDNDEDLPPKTRTHEEWAKLFDGLGEKLGKFDKYLMVFDSYKDRKAIYGSLSDDLADIYWELKDGLTALEEGTNKARVIWQWRWMFWTHWGRHANSAVRVIHDYLSENAEL